MEEDICPKCGGEVLWQQCIDCGIDLEGYEQEIAESPTLMPETMSWLNDLGLPMYESLKDEDE